MIPGRAGRARRDRFQQELTPVLDGLYRSALGMIRESNQAQDLVQEAALKAYRFFDTYKPGTNFRAWIYRVLYTVFVNKTREKKNQTTPLEHLADPAWTQGPLEEELGRATHRERVQAVMESVDDSIKLAISELPEELRTVFLLSSVEGLKYREIADVLDCPLGTVMSRLFRSRRLLQEKLAVFARESGFDKSQELTDQTGRTS